MGASQDGGGTLHCPSPTHIHHVDPASALRQLRRSLSRSPSKGPTFRLVTSKSTSPSPGSPLSPSPLSPHARLGLGPTSPLSQSNSPLPSPLAIPFPPATKKYRIGARKVSPAQAETSSYNLLRSPIKRGLSDSTDLGNSSQSSSNCSASGLENKGPESPSLNSKLSHGALAAPTSSEKVTDNSESLLAPRHAFARLERSGSFLSDLPVKSSPLKRSDGTMDLDYPSLDSPSAKRRSLHGASFGVDFDIFDQAMQSFNSATTDNYKLNDKSMSDGLVQMDTSHIFSPQRRKSSSLRRTTLQQRCEKPNFARAKPNTDLAHELATPLPVGSKGRPRISLDNFLPPAPRDSPFSTPGNLPNASIHPVMQRKELNVAGAQFQPSRHPLSRTVTQSSSASSLAEDSPTHLPVRQPDARRPLIDFSKSLPYGVNGLDSQEHGTDDAQTQASSGEASFSTPENYKLARPLPAAFMSTGLISKRHKNPNMSPENVLGASTFMPDTPCKRPTSMAEPPGPAPGAPAGKSRHNRHSMHNFGTPSTPFNPHMGKPARTSFGRGVNIFGSGFGSKVNRRGSFLSVEGDEVSPSPSQADDSQSSADFNPSSTPSKLILLGTPHQNDLETQSPENFSRVMNSSTEPVLPSQYCKSTIQSSPRESVNGDGDSYLEDSPSTALRFRSFSAISSFSARSRLLRRQFKSPTPLSRNSFTLPRILIKALETKSSPLSPASPTNSRRDGMSPCAPHTPHTPHQEGMFPDPSGLSISAQGDGQGTAGLGSSNINYLTYPLPSTPTASRDYFSQLGKSTSTMTPTHGSHAAEFDPVLTARFGKVEVVGTGEFSQVYRVTAKSSDTNVSPSTTAGSPKRSDSRQVWAMKKSRNAYIGPRDRMQKLKEVEVLKILAGSNHIIQLFDSWEHRKHLYIQTEYCDEGGLDLFLVRAGRRARLDDFRIWKIVLDLATGLQHIHNANFIHLDLKPANIFITFDGVVKIGDFGMAASWPADPNIEGEGDREYIGPEILRGQFDKPADIFALGLIVFEMAGNVMLPDNGVSWQRLRSGDMSDVSSLTSTFSAIERDASGEPLHTEQSLDKIFGPVCEPSHLESGESLPDAGFKIERMARWERHALERGYLINPPEFVVDKFHPQALDNVVRWMISPEPVDRPVAGQIIETVGCQWVQRRRACGATVYEGNYGPAVELQPKDAEMLDA